MGNLRIQNVQVFDSTSIDITFTEELVPELVTANVSILADTPNVPDSEVLGVKVSGNTLSVSCQPLTPLAAYFLQFQSTDANPFISIHGEFRLPQDGVSNRYLITGPLSPDNPVKNYLNSFFKDNIYNLDNDSTIVSKYIQSLAVTLSRALYDIRQVKNENYLSFTVTDEKHVRGEGPFDRLNEEGAYQIIRVGKGLTASNATATFPYDPFPSFPIALQRTVNNEILTPSSQDNIGEFNVNTLTFNLSATPVTKVTSITFLLDTANPNFVYDIETLGYQIKDSRYDQDFAFSYTILEDNQVKINERILSDSNFALDSIISVTIQYESKNLGIVVNSETVNVYTVLDATREVLPPIINVFSLQHAPVVDGNGDVPVLAGLTLIDPNNNTPNAVHPAFTQEIPFRLNALPARPGQYSVDYASGTVYVYGADLNNEGTGPYPPLATYKYKLTYKTEQDYVYDPDLLDLVALPLGNLVDNSGTIVFDYEEVLVPGVDYKAELHQEELTERVENRLLALNTLRVKSAPITNVFRIYNETSGEIYTLNRWNYDKVYFRYINPPRVNPQVGERSTFNNVINELLTASSTFTNTNSLRVFKILLNNNLVISSTEDTIGSSINSSLTFSNGNVFVSEIWFDRELSTEGNADRLAEEGQYVVDYFNGVLYVAVSSTQDFNIGTANYKNNNIIPQFPHLISVEDIYYRISPLLPKNKNFSYISFDDNSIVPGGLEYSDEIYLNDNVTGPYQISNGSVGVFVDAGFVSGVTNQVKFVRGLFEFSDLVNSTHPLNFSNVSSSNGFNVTVEPIENQFYDTVQQDVDGYYVVINENVPYLSANINYSFAVVRTSDSMPLWDGTGTVVPGDPLRLTLPGINSPNVGDLVSVTYTFTIVDLSRIAIDYNKGDLFVDYTYVADEIIVSYEHGDNVLDYRTSKALAPNTEYFVTYKAGALRDALLKNFGTLVNIPELANFDVSFNRERYRDALTAALSSFIQGPTVTAIKNIGKTISHIEPEIIESIFQGWSLGNSSLFAQEIKTNGSFELLPAKYGNGVVVNQPDQTISFPVNSNIRLEEGTFETWISPLWNGIDNDANLTFTITKDGYTVDPLEVFIGVSEFHPELSSDGKFSINKLNEAAGTPNLNKDGLFIYYDNDSAGDFQRWYLRVIDGYVDAGTSGYKIKINSNGTFYDVKSLVLPKPSNMTIFSGVSVVNLSIASGVDPIDEGITFISDLEHYLLDFGKDKSRSRLSIFKDVSGYLNFRVYDKDRTPFAVSTDVSGWKFGDLHHVGASWKLNTHNDRDEMHLFIDGLEVPNIIKYGQKLRPYLHENFRTVDPEEIVGLADRDIVASVDLHTVAGSPTVTSSLNFDDYNIFAGDIIYIDEYGFDPDGYTILSKSGQSLTLSASMPITLTDGKFSINKTSYTVTSDIDTAPNIVVLTSHVFLDGYDLTGTAATDTVSSSIDFEDAGVLPGFFIRIDDPDLPVAVSILQVSGTSLVLETPLPNTLAGNDFWIYSREENEIPGVRALRPAYSISKDSNFNNVLTIFNDVFADDLIFIKTLGINHRSIKRQYYVWSDGYENVLMTKMPPPISLDEAHINKVILSNTSFFDGYETTFNVFQPTESQNGRTLEVTIGGTNADYNLTTSVTIDGYTSGMTPVSETLIFDVFNDGYVLDTTNLFAHVNFITIVATAINPLRSKLNVSIKEKYSIDHFQGDGYADGYSAIIRFSYFAGGGYNLFDDGTNVVRDENNTFSHHNIGNYLCIKSPSSVAGYYIVTDISEDLKSLTVESTATSPSLPLASFIGGIYQLLNTTDYRSGLQGGYFTIEDGYRPGMPFFLSSGFYELEYDTYDRIKFDPVNDFVYLGSNYEGHFQLNGIMDQVKIYSVMLTDTRVGESIPSNQRSITKDYNSLKALKSDSNTLMLINFDIFPFSNSASEYIDSTYIKDHFHSNVVVNENFGNSLAIGNKPLILSNDGILDTKKEGSIEFWVNPDFDTGNDPIDRFYFDAYGAVIEEVTSINNVSLKLSGPASRILNVTLAAGDPRIDYFAGGKLEVDTQNATREEATSIGTGIVLTSRLILQVITVKIDGDLTGIDYFAEGSIGPDKKTIYLGKQLPQSNMDLIITYQAVGNANDKLNTQVVRLNRRLPYENSKVRVSYIPRGLQGDRISIYKDNFGYVNFGISASGTDYVVRAPTRWVKNTWHRVKATYKINGGSNTDELRLFLDGYQYSNVLFGTGLIFGTSPMVMGASMPGDGYLTSTISFKDPINELFIGAEYTGQKSLFSLIDNFRISNISRPLYAPFGEPIDVNYSSNLNTVFPVTMDLYTTYLLDFGPTIIKNDDFTLLKNRETGLFNFLVEIFDSFDIIKDSAKVQEVLEKLIKVLKPANSKVFIEYIG